MTTQTEMEQLLENIDRRLARVEQKLPTLATKDDLERFATKDDLERYATKDDVEGAKQLARMLNESTEHKIKLVADGVSDLQGRFGEMSRQLTTVSHQLEKLTDRL